MSDNHLQYRQTEALASIARSFVRIAAAAERIALAIAPPRTVPRPPPPPADWEGNNDR